MRPDEAKAKGNTGKRSLKDRLAKQIKAKKNATQPPVAQAEVPASKEPAHTVHEENNPSSGSEVQTRSEEVSGSKVFINLGRKDGYNAQRLKDVVADLGGLLPEDIHSASIRPRFSFLTLDEEYIEDLLEAINGEKVKGRTLRIERARDE